MENWQQSVEAGAGFENEQPVILTDVYIFIDDFDK